MLVPRGPQSPEMWTNAIIWEILRQMANEVPSRREEDGMGTTGWA
jgi:hypothetical protein